MNPETPIAFTKMSGTGNDFIIIDHRDGFLDGIDIPAFVRTVCRRSFSVGADGVILIEEADNADFRWQFFNADGSRAEMCGNGARCAARFAFDRKIAPASMSFMTDAGMISAEILGANVKIRLTPPADIRLGMKVGLGGEEVEVHFINTGVPHVVYFVEDGRDVPVAEWGRLIRYHRDFQPAGTNVNFVRRLGGNSLLVRTYERGVEAETMACGTGAVASAIISALKAGVEPPVTVTTSGGARLVIHFSLSGGSLARGDGIFLEGPARTIYHGQLQSGALETDG